MRPERAREDALERGATRFGRVEGAHFGDDALWFADTVGGEAFLGQLFRLRPRPAGDLLELVFESTDRDALTAPDNLTGGPTGALWLAEDRDEGSRLSVLSRGRTYPFAQTRIDGSEITGPCFSPDGRTLFLNLQEPGMTMAIWGPFTRRA